jgi:hypothetical protein
MKYKWVSIILLLATLFTNISIFAALDKTLYSVTLPVASESAADLQKAFPQALNQVLVQVSGNANIANSAFIQQQLPQASTYIQSYTYENNAVQNTPQNLVLKIKFDPRGVNQLLAKAGQAPQPATQYPPILVWLAVQAGQAHTILDTNAQDPVATVLYAAAQPHHLTVLLPLLDLQDMNDITADQVWQLDTQTAIAASVRYNVQHILLGRVSSTANGQWQGDWVLIGPQRNWQWHTTGNTPEIILQDVLKNVTQTFIPQSTNSATPASPPQHVKVHISGVSGIDQFAGIVKYFRGLAPVNHVETAGVANNALTLDVTVAGSAETLDNAIQQGQSLLPDATAANSNTELYYQWMGSAE